MVMFRETAYKLLLLFYNMVVETDCRTIDTDWFSNHTTTVVVHVKFYDMIQQ